VTSRPVSILTQHRNTLAFADLRLAAWRHR
jgi:hypothetical protein